MFDLFKKKATDQLARPNVSMIRARTRALIRTANDAESARSREPVLIPGARASKEQWRAIASGEDQLAQSIAAAVSGDLTIGAILSQVIQPILEEAVVVSAAAHGAVLRAVGTARGS